MYKGILEPCKFVRFRLLFSAQIISDLGNWLDFTALLVLVGYHWELGAGSLALLTVCIGLPGLLLGPITGVFVDRLPLKKVMIISDLCRALIVAGLIFADNFYTVLALVFLKGVCSTFFDPARQSAIKLVVPKEHLLKANALSQLSVNCSKIIGPSLGSAVLLLATPKIAFLLDSLTYLISMIILLFIKNLNFKEKDRVITEKNPNKVKTFFNEFIEGLSFILSKKVLLTLILFNGTVFFVVYLFDSLGVLLAKDMGIKDSFFGIFISIVGVGAMVGAITIVKWGGQINQMKILQSIALFLGVMLLITGMGGEGYLPNSIILWLIIWFFIGFSIGSISVCYGYLLQLETPQTLMGRVTGTANALVNGSMVISPVIGSFLAIWIKVSGVFLLSGFLIIILGVTMLLLGRKVITVESKNKSMSGSN
jgi:MFS family permease